MRGGRSFIVIAAVALATASGCGGSGQSGPQTPTSATSPSAGQGAPALSGTSRADRQAVLTTVSAYYSALQAHQGPQACGYLTPGAQHHVVAQITAHTTHFGHTCTQILGGVGLLLSGRVRVISGSVGPTTARLLVQGKTRGSMTLAKTAGRWQISSTS